MNQLMEHRPQTAPVHNFTPAPTNLLQRRCACGGTPGPTGECAECRRKRLAGLKPEGQRSSGRSTGSVLPKPGGSSSGFRPGYDFSKMPVSPVMAGTSSARPEIAGGGNEPGAAPQSAVSADAATADAAPADATPADATPAEVVPAAPAEAAPADAGIPSTPAVEDAAGTAPASAGLSWSHVLQFPHDALWWFCGEHPTGFSTTARLRATGFSDPSLLSWRITLGGDKVAFRGAATGEEVSVRSTAGSTRAGDVTIEVREGTGAGAPTFSGNLTVRRPHRLIHRSDTDHGACPGWAACPVACPAYWTEIGYRVVDNVGGTIVGATVNENFPGAKTNDQLTDWD
ncbi:MAG TPA: hypothetical protein VJ827_09540, partial [Rubrobacter sp.]|nr:hypothetical protein [Rubrobacter sp.]